MKKPGYSNGSPSVTSKRRKSWSVPGSRVRVAVVCAWISLLPSILLLSLLPAGAADLKPVETRHPVTSPEARAQLRRILEQNAPLLEAQATVLKTVAKLVGPTVVYIEADVPQRTLAHNLDRHVEEKGSGVIIQWKGRFYVLTARHVFRNAPADGIRIDLADGRRLHPQRVLEDEATDVGVLPIEATDLIASQVGDSDRMEIGDFVLAVGSPFALSHSVTFGIISARGRRDLEFGDVSVRFQDFLQTDAAINLGSSGGPLCNLRGEIIGINTAIASNSGGFEGIGFSIPINLFMSVARQLIDTGKVTRGFLGVSVARFGPAVAAELGMARATGARVTAIIRGGPAEAAGLREGDVILKLDATAIDDDAHLVNLVALIEVGKKVSLEVFRDGKTIVIPVEVADRSKFGP
jgi:serine protease Do